MATTTPNADRFEELMEVRLEITRLNRLAGETVFNPAATMILNSIMKELHAKAERPVNTNGWSR